MDKWASSDLFGSLRSLPKMLLIGKRGASTSQKLVRFSHSHQITIEKRLEMLYQKQSQFKDGKERRDRCDDITIQQTLTLTLTLEEKP